MKNRMTPLVEQIYFSLMGAGGKTSKTIHFKLRNDVIGFIKKYSIKNPIIIKNMKGKRVLLHLPSLHI